MAIMRRERTEELKAKRRIYGDRGGHLHFSEHKYVPRPDGISNAITTFDNFPIKREQSSSLELPSVRKVARSARTTTCCLPTASR